MMVVKFEVQPEGARPKSGCEAKRFESPLAEQRSRPSLDLQTTVGASNNSPHCGLRLLITEYSYST